MMNEYLVVFRDGANEIKAIHEYAHRVEGWSNDYAFFGHPTALGEVTVIYPREIIQRVQMVHRGADEKELLHLQGEELETRNALIERKRST